jgi:glycosyltransferase involved in cell wall biosynthesis
MVPSVDYTIIIPHYNIPELLVRCLKSIPARDDIQIIVIDDGSNERNKSILKEIEQTFPYIQFIYQENLGGGAARNKGLSIATGKYILFLDADDYFNYCINEILDQYKHSDFDITFFNVNAVDTDLYTQSYRCIHINKMFNLYTNDKKKGEFQMRYAYGEPWGKIIRHDLIIKNNIQFEETSIHNDTQFSYQTGFYAKKIFVDQRAICCITNRTNSVSKKLSADRLLTRVAVFSRQFKFLKEHGISFLDNRIFLSFDYCKKNNLKQELRECYSIASKYGLSHSKLSSFHRKMILKKRAEFISRIISKIKK